MRRDGGEMSWTNFERFNILFKSRVVKEMTIEDLEFWKGFEKIYPSYVRFPESIEFNQRGYSNRTKSIRELKDSIKRIDKIIKELFDSSTLPAKRSKEVEIYLKKEVQRLELHLNRLKKLKQKLRLEEENQNSSEDGG